MSRPVTFAVVLGLLVGACADQPEPGTTPAVPAPPADVASGSAPEVAASEPGDPAPAVGAETAARRAETIAPRGRAGRKRDREAGRPAGRAPSAGITLRGEGWHDFGTVPQGTVLRHAFVLDSDGEGPLTIHTVKTTCECATHGRVLLEGPGGERTELEAGGTIAPGTSFLLEVESSTSAARGPFHSNVVLYTSAPDPVHVELRAIVQPVLEIEPPQIGLGRVTTAEPARGSATVRSTGGQRFRLEQARGTVEHFVAELAPIDPDADGRASEWRVDVLLEPNALLGERVYRLHLVSDLPTGSSTGTPLVDLHAVELVATVEVTEAFRADPQFVTFGRVAPGATAEATVELECLGRVGLPEDTVIRLEPVPGTPLVPAESLAFELHREEGGLRARLDARLVGLPAGSAGSYGAILVLAPGVEGLPDLRLRLYVSCAPAGER